MYLTAFLAKELARMAQHDRLLDADQARLVRLAASTRNESHPGPSLRERITLAVRPTPATCQPC